MRTLTRLLSIVLGALVIVVGAPSTAEAQTRAALVRDMDGPVRGTRFIERVQFGFNAGVFSVTETLSPVIPAGKKWFVQSVSMHTLLTDGQSLMEARVTLDPGDLARVWINQTFQAAGTSQRHFTGNQELNLLLSPGESLRLFLFRNDNLGNSSLNFGNATFIGYLVDAAP